MSLQVELSRLSRVLFHAGAPAVGISFAALFVLTVGSGPPFDRTARSIVFPVAVAAGTVPLAL
ncbi:hypothetical protein [Halosolutus halophilus]|uniref:hypothetical protein n=1 Tax=Halosolutus halophilus TaxID=1552990 RepID=UPI002234F4EA|nr:hypothetical protein [Halosolutus halophilus]